MSDRSDEPRFEFGENWKAFLETVDQDRVAAAAESLDRLLGSESLVGKTFLDVGCGSGLVSLAAFLAGASVTSFDFDPASVACTREIQRRFAPAATSAIDGPFEISDSDSTSDFGRARVRGAAAWQILAGSALDAGWLESLGSFDIVYSWGVLHHTGQLARGIELTCQRVAVGGLLVLAVYHDQGAASRRWAMIKRTYHRLPGRLRPLWVAAIAAAYETKFALARIAAKQNPLPFRDWRSKRADRGMSVWHDWVDWVGGWPFEVASPDAIINPLAEAGFSLRRIKTVGNGWGCNEYVFRRDQ